MVEVMAPPSKGLLHTRTQRKEQSGSPWQRCGSVEAYCRVRSTKYSSAFMGHFAGAHHCLYYLHHSLASGQIKGRENNPSGQHKIGLEIYYA